MQYKLTLLTLILISINGCSSSNRYYAAQQYQANQCLQTQVTSQAQYNDCIKQSDKSYDEYSLERKEIIEYNNRK